MKLLYRLISLLFPPKCVLCGSILKNLETDLCYTCRCDTPDVPNTKIKLPYLAHWTALWYYEGNVRSSLLRYKFLGRRSYAEIYSRLLGMKLLREAVSFDILTWVPISKLRKWRRGYDQVELIAKAMGKELGCAPIRTLRKIRNNPPQSRMTGAPMRRANVLGIYRVEHPEILQGKTVLLLDDILTTGATAGECARVLLTAGAKQVCCATIATVSHQHKNSR